MLNYIATFITSWLVGADGPLKAVGRMSQSEQIAESARVPTIFENAPLHWGFVFGILVAVLVYFTLFKTPLGFEIRTVGANPSAARYAGINLKRILLATMAIAGLLAGMAGALEVMASPGFRYRYSAALGSGYGFDSIAVALLAKNNPIAVVAAAILFGSLRHGASTMQFDTVSADGRQLPADLILIIQALVILFVAADQVLRWLFRMRAQAGQGVVLTRGWGKTE
jgi:simple sugar transport system permease protein